MFEYCLDIPAQPLPRTPEPVCKRCDGTKAISTGTSTASCMCNGKDPECFVCRGKGVYESVRITDCPDCKPNTPEPLTDGVIHKIINEAFMERNGGYEYTGPPPKVWAEAIRKAHALGRKQGMAETERKYAAVMELAGKDVLFFAEGGKPCLLCSDTFSYASADAEPVTLDEAEYLLELYGQFSYDGPMAWCSMKRNWLPVLSQLDTDRFKQACDAIKARIQEIENGRA